jgi:hypothetical protein
MATHTEKQLDFAIDKMFKVAKKINVPLLTQTV